MGPEARGARMFAALGLALALVGVSPWGATFVIGTARADNGTRDGATSDEGAGDSNTETLAPDDTTDLTIEVLAKREGISMALADATVTVTSPAGTSISKTSNEIGKAEFEELARGVVDVAVSAPGLQAYTGAVELKDERQTLQLTLSRPLGSLTIQVLGVDGDDAIPIADCRIRIKDDGGESRSLPDTDEHGVVTANNLPFGAFTIIIIATGWETAVRTFELAQEEEDLKVELTKQEPPADEDG